MQFVAFMNSFVVKEIPIYDEQRFPLWRALLPFIILAVVITFSLNTTENRFLPLKDVLREVLPSYDVHVRPLVHRWALIASRVPLMAVLIMHNFLGCWLLQFKMMVLAMYKVRQLKKHFKNSWNIHWTSTFLMNSIFVKFRLFRTFGCSIMQRQSLKISLHSRRADWTSEKVEQSRCNWLGNRFSQSSIYFEPKPFLVRTRLKHGWKFKASPNFIIKSRNNNLL